MWPRIYLLKKVVCLFFCHVEISQMITPFPMLLGLLKSHPWIQVHQGGYIMFKPTRQEILNIGQFIVIEYFIKSTVKHLEKLGCTFVIVGKSQWIGFDENDFLIFRPNELGKYWILSNIYHYKLNKISNFKFNQLGNKFTFGPMIHRISVYKNIYI
jgi:hypothetical protein